MMKLQLLENMGQDAQADENITTYGNDFDNPVDEVKEGKFLKFKCSHCTESFVLDLEEDWDAAPEEFELIGRDFLGFSKADVLCPGCLSSVKLAGAERIYWKLAHC